MRKANTLIAAVAAILMGVAAPVWAVDGCKVLLCLAGPWQSIPACRAEVERLFQDLWSGEPFPKCRFATAPAGVQGMGGAGIGSAANTWLGQEASAPDPNCPGQAVTSLHRVGRTTYGCRYVGMVTLDVEGRFSSTTYWDTGGNSVTYQAADAPLSWSAQGKQSGTYPQDPQDLQEGGASAPQGRGPGGF